MQATDRDALLGTLASLDVAAYLHGAGLSEDDLAAARYRLLEAASAST